MDQSASPAAARAGPAPGPAGRWPTRRTRPRPTAPTCASAGSQAVIPVKEDQKKHRRNRGRAGGRPPAFDAGRYKERNTVERCFGKLKQFRAVATRYDKREYMYQGTVDVASIRIWLRDPVP